MGGSTTNELVSLIEIFLLHANIQPIFYQSEYAQYFEESIFDNPKLKEFKPDVIYIYTTSVNIKGFPRISDTSPMIEEKLRFETESYCRIWDSLEKEYQCPIIQNNFDYPINRPLGNLDCCLEIGKTNFLLNLNLFFAKASRERRNLFISDINYLSSFVGLREWFDKNLWYSYKYAISYTGLVHLAKNISIILKSIFGKSKKCLVLDLDNTCWGGVIGDDGIDNIQIGNETAVGQAHQALQKYIIELKERGVVLAVCSKNDDNMARTGFSHPDSVLKISDFASFKANWKPKHENLVDICNEIKILPDALVFIDDNPMERDLVSQHLEEVGVPDIGHDIANFVEFIDREGYFEPVQLSHDDMKRSEYYQGNSQRNNYQAEFSDYNEYLVSLQMESEIATFSPLYAERIAQLTNKTNQFNLTTKRFTLDEIKRMMSLNSEYICLYGKLRDKFGDNGLISVVIGRIEKQNELHLDLWLMSCRVIKRGMEFAMLDALMKLVANRNIDTVYGYYIESPNNTMVKNLYRDFGFTCIEKNDSASKWIFEGDYKNKNKIIKVHL